MDRSKEFDLLLQLYRRSLSKKERDRLAKKKNPPYVYPLALEWLFAKQISEFHADFIHEVEQKLNEGLLAQGKYMGASFADEYDRFIKEMEDELSLTYGMTFEPGSPSYTMLYDISKRLYKQNVEQWQKQLMEVIGLKWVPVEDWWPAVQREWEETNQAYMRKQAQDYMTKLTALLLMAKQSGWTVDVLRSSIGKLNSWFTGYKADVLARDQVGYLNAAIWMQEYAEIGLPFYIWHTAMDERVRGNPTGKYPKAIPSHYVMEGLLMKWDNPAIYSDDGGKSWKQKTGIMEPLHVGMAFACRCVPLPYLGDKIAKADSDMERTV